MPLHTRFLAKNNPMVDRKWWILHGLHAAGTIYIDQGAFKAITNTVQKSSLFSAGIVGCKGTFVAQQSVRVVYQPKKEKETDPEPQEIEVGKGLVNYASHEILRIMGCHSRQIVERLGYADAECMVSMDDPTLPKTQPLKTLLDLLAWQPEQDAYNVSNTPLHPRPRPAPTPWFPGKNLSSDKAQSLEDSLESEHSASAPFKDRAALRDCCVIVCHDMDGGYKEDAAPQGNDYSEIYNIQYWSHIDTFIYFSHNRVSIPPPVWTNAAHRNGVLCLGTVITEWLEGILETESLVNGPGMVYSEDPDEVDRRWYSRTYADRLVDMAVYYKFDGWFINIESILRGGSKQANQMIAFLKYLRAQIHKRIPGGELIWYDSVISTGEVAWQDKLSPENYAFFEQSDGIFTNYTWMEKAVSESVKLAGVRNRDVYTGIDVWGRNTFGGGGYAACRALEVIQRDRTSAALFAPAWTYQHLGKANFMAQDQLFWTGYNGAGIHAESLAAPHGEGIELVLGDGKKFEGKFKPLSAYIPARPSGCSSWFYTNFDRGFGKGFWVNGKSLAPCMTKEVFIVGEDYALHGQKQYRPRFRWILSPKDAYQGGTSLCVQELRYNTPEPSSLPVPILPTPGKQSISIMVPLYDVHISLMNAENSSVELVYKPNQANIEVGMHLGMTAGGLDPRTLFTEKSWPRSTPSSQEPLTIGKASKDIVAPRDAVWQSQPLALVTLASSGHGTKYTTTVAVPKSLDDLGKSYTIEPLQDGWFRLTLHLSSLMSVDTLRQSQSQEAMSTIVLSQLGITLTYENDADADAGADADFSTHSLVTLGSFAVVPSWSLHFHGSCVIAVASKDTRVDTISQPSASLVRERAQEASIQSNVEEGGEDWLRVSSTLKWTVGHCVVPSGFSSVSSVSSVPVLGPSPDAMIPTTDCSHYCVYLSAVDDPYQAQFVGTAFTTQFRVSNFELLAPKVEAPTPTPAPQPPQPPQQPGGDLNVPVPTRKVWAFVQGVCRDGRADSANMWAKCLL
ncbi:hypothetical protein BGZ82_010304 [Podila clonocystis]|nr:hypothetical protein BGZ82_010304 [Podila clonocystis]